MKFYSVDWWDKEMGPKRAHFSSKKSALDFAMKVESQLEIEVDLHVLKPTRENVMLALDHACNLGNDGPIWYPGEVITVGVFRPSE